MRSMNSLIRPKYSVVIVKILTAQSPTNQANLAARTRAMMVLELRTWSS